MPLLSRTAVHTTFYALSLLAIFCANPSAAETTSIAPHRFPSISPITTPCDSTCTHEEHAACVSRHRACLTAHPYLIPNEPSPCQNAVRAIDAERPAELGRRDGTVQGCLDVEMDLDLPVSALPGSRELDLNPSAAQAGRRLAQPNRHDVDRWRPPFRAMLVFAEPVGLKLFLEAPMGALPQAVRARQHESLHGERHVVQALELH